MSLCYICHSFARCTGDVAWKHTQCGGFCLCSVVQHFSEKLYCFIAMLSGVTFKLMQYCSSITDFSFISPQSVCPYTISQKMNAGRNAV